MKLRKRQMPNGKWLCEGKKWHWRSWRALEFCYFDSGHSIERGNRARYIVDAEPGDAHYMTMQKATEEAADAHMREIESTLGICK